MHHEDSLPYVHSPGGHFAPALGHCATLECAALPLSGDLPGWHAVCTFVQGCHVRGPPLRCGRFQGFEGKLGRMLTHGAMLGVSMGKVLSRGSPLSRRQAAQVRDFRAESAQADLASLRWSKNVGTTRYYAPVNPSEIPSGRKLLAKSRACATAAGLSVWAIRASANPTEAYTPGLTLKQAFRAMVKGLSAVARDLLASEPTPAKTSEGFTGRALPGLKAQTIRPKKSNTSGPHMAQASLPDRGAAKSPVRALPTREVLTGKLQSPRIRENEESKALAKGLRVDGVFSAGSYEDTLEERAPEYKPRVIDSRADTRSNARFAYLDGSYPAIRARTVKAPIPMVSRVAPGQCVVIRGDYVSGAGTIVYPRSDAPPSPTRAGKGR